VRGRSADNCARQRGRDHGDKVLQSQLSRCRRLLFSHVSIQNQSGKHEARRPSHKDADKILLVSCSVGDFPLHGRKDYQCSTDLCRDKGVKTRNLVAQG
jgi:hypothetical protein